ncbi:MAG: Nucleolar GTP-binding protein 1 [Marteilia pararefringens]
MIKVVEKQKEALSYLESVRQHLTRLPRIDPSKRTIILTGFPNVGKSSFLNSISCANVDVQPYPFTTRSIYVGASEAYGLRWQILDTPGLLDKELDQRNSIEMLSISALAHLRACVIYFFDLSEQCGYSFEEQMSLFENMKVLFKNKPLLVALNKSDQFKLEDAPTEIQEAIKNIGNNMHQIELENEGGDNSTVNRQISFNSTVPIFEISTKENLNINNLKLDACKLLLKQRIETKLRSLKKAEHTAQLLKIHYPDDNSDYPQKKATNQSNKANSNNFELDVEHFERIAEKIIQNPRIMSRIENQEDIYDQIPELYMGYNIQDFVGKEVDSKIKELIEEETERVDNSFYTVPLLPDDDETRQRKLLAATIRDHKLKSKKISQLKNGRTKTVITGAAKKAKKPSLLAKERYFSALRKEDPKRFNRRPSKYALSAKSNSEVSDELPSEGEKQKMELAEKRNKISEQLAKKSDQQLLKNSHKQRESNFNRLPAHIFKGKANKKGRIF